MIPNMRKAGPWVFFVLLTLGILTGLQAWVSTLDVNMLGPERSKMLITLIAVVSSAPAAFVVGLGRNIWGYLRNFFGNGLTEDYDFKRLYKTCLYYIGIITTAVTVMLQLPLPASVSGILSGIIVVIGTAWDFIEAETKKH